MASAFSQRFAGGSYGSFVYQLLQVGLGVFALDAIFSLIHNTLARSITIALSAPITLIAGVVILLDVHGAVEALRAELRRRGKKGFVMDWPSYSWRVGGFGLGVMGLGFLIGGLLGLQ